MRTTRIPRRRFPHYINTYWISRSRYTSTNYGNNLCSLRHNSINNKQTLLPKHSRSTRSRDYLNNLARHHPSISSPPLPTSTLPHRRSEKPPSNFKSHWTPMVLKIRIFKLKSQYSIRLLHNPHRRPYPWAIPPIRSR